MQFGRRRCTRGIAERPSTAHQRDQTGGQQNQEQPASGKRELDAAAIPTPTPVRVIARRPLA